MPDKTKGKFPRWLNPTPSNQSAPWILGGGGGNQACLTGSGRVGNQATHFVNVTGKEKDPGERQREAEERAL